MTDKIKKMTDSHLAVEEAMESIIAVVRQIRDTDRIDNDLREELRRHTEEFVAALGDHVVMGHEQVGDLSERIFGEKPREVEALDEQSEKLLAEARRLETGVEALEVGEPREVPAWNEFEEHLRQAMQTLESCGEQEWKFYSHYGTILFPGGAASE